MADIAIRYKQNPLLSPKDLEPSNENMIIECLLNPGVFKFYGKIGLLVRVAERTIQKEGVVSVPIYNDFGKVEILDFDLNDPKLDASDARVINYDGTDYLTTISHLRLLFSDSGTNFEASEMYPSLFGEGEYESFGIEDCRVSKIEDVYYLTYTMVSPNGVGVGLRTTKDWKKFEKKGMIFSPHNKDCAIFEEKINGKYYALHAAPIKTDKGWLMIYHGATDKNRYCLGAILLDLEDPSIVIARSQKPIMEPIATYEKTGFFGNVVFTNGHIVDGDTIKIYYGASDEHVCLANCSINQILKTLEK